MRRFGILRRLLKDEATGDRLQATVGGGACSPLIGERHAERSVRVRGRLEQPTLLTVAYRL